MNHREVMQQALEALDRTDSEPGSIAWEREEEAIAALRAALAKPNDDYERGFIDGMKKQAQSSVDKAVNGLALPTCKEDLQDEPVAGVVLNEEGRPALVEHGQEDWHCANRKARRLYTHPAQQREPQKPVVNQQMTTEPVAWMYPDDYERMTTSEAWAEVFSVQVSSPTQGKTTVPLYTHPAPQRQPLTDETLWEMWVESPSDVLRFARAIEIAHGIGGQDGQK